MCVASLGGHNILPYLIFHHAFIKLRYKNIEKTLLEKNETDIVVSFKNYLQTKPRP